jgi:hypothetical protein
MALTKVTGDGVGTLASATITSATISNQLTDANMSAGSVIQTVFGTYETQVSNTTSTFADTGLNATITPTSSSNKILVTVMQNGVYKDGSAEAGCQIQLLRGSTVISQLAKRAGGDNGSGSAATMSIGTVGASILDNANTTSATTYKTQFKSASNASTVYVQIYTCDSTIILQEIVV